MPFAAEASECVCMWERVKYIALIFCVGKQLFSSTYCIVESNKPTARVFIPINEDIFTEHKLKVENIVAKEEISRFEQFLLLSQCFQNSSAAEAS